MADGRLVWQQGSSDPENMAHLDAIAQWWQQLDQQEIELAQRLLPESDDLGAVDWQPQRFDERFTVQAPRVGGITLYWQKPDSKEERSITVRKLELEPRAQRLYIYSQAQRQVVMRVAIPGLNYQTLKLHNPQIVGKASGEGCVLLLRDSGQQLEIELVLDRDGIGQLLASLPG
ncbi:MAG: hypothetical protein HC910_04450 [Spirulinaceae cyanobacterium SM2_1_0]|nr:hypothetical protein [Spirulinaceae cyanobacterium SM2_1_0]